MEHEKIADAIKSKFFIKVTLNIVGTTNSLFSEGAKYVTVLDTFKDRNQAFLVGSHLLIELLKTCPELIVNTAGVSHLRCDLSVKINLIIGVFVNRPFRSTLYAWISNYSANIDFLWGLAQRYAQVIADAYMKYKNATNCQHFYVTFGSSLNIVGRDADYMRTGLYLEDTCLQKLDPLPGFLTAADIVMLENFGIVACKSHPILANNVKVGIST
jgi:hypothetical protein